MYCQHSWQTQQWMPIKQSEVGWNDHCVGLHARAAPLRQWRSFFFQWNHIGHQIMMCMELVSRSSANKTSGGMSLLVSLDREPVIHTNCSFWWCRRKKSGDKSREELSKRREKGLGRVFGRETEKSRQEGKGDKRRGLSLISNTLALVSHGDALGLCQGETDGLGKWGGALGTGYDV